MLITFVSIWYVCISKICFDFLKRIIPHTSWGSTFYCSSMWCSIFRQKTLLQLLRVSRRWQPTYRTRSSRQVIWWLQVLSPWSAWTWFQTLPHGWFLKVRQPSQHETSVKAWHNRQRCPHRAWLAKLCKWMNNVIQIKYLSNNGY